MYKNQSKNTYTQKSMNKRIIFTIMIKMNMLANHTLQNLVSKYITSEDCTTRLKHTQKQMLPDKSEPPVHSIQLSEHWHPKCSQHFCVA